MAASCECVTTGEACAGCLGEFTQLVPAVWRATELIRPADCQCAEFRAWAPLALRQLPVLVCFDGPRDGCDDVLEALSLSVELVNKFADGTPLRFVGCRPTGRLLDSGEQAGRAICVVATRSGRGPHGMTSMMHCKKTGRVVGSVARGSCESGFARQVWKLRKQRPVIQMQLRSKTELPAVQRKKAYVSTLSHELLHVLGFGHISEAGEIMSVGRGGTCICERCEYPPTELRSSPKTQAAVRWLYSRLALALQGRLQGVPVHCSQCFGCGWSPATS